MNEFNNDANEYVEYGKEFSRHENEMNMNAQISLNKPCKEDHQWMKSLFQKVIVLFLGVTSVVLVVEAMPQSSDLEIYEISYHYISLILTTDDSGSVEIKGDDYQDVYLFEAYSSSHDYPHEEETTAYIPSYFIQFVGLRSGAWYEIKVKDARGFVIHKESIQTPVLQQADLIPVPEIAYFSYHSDPLNKLLYLSISLNDTYHFLYDFQYVFVINDKEITVTSLEGSLYGGSVDMSQYDFYQVYQIKITAKSRHPLTDSSITYYYDIIYEGER